MCALATLHIDILLPALWKKAQIQGIKRGYFKESRRDY